MRKNGIIRATGSTANQKCRALLCVGVMILQGCGGAPYVDSRREAGQTTMVGASTPELVAICYSSQGTTPDEILDLANLECGKTGRTAQFSHQDIAACNLSTPTRAFFNCVATP